jgi:hypothetical protein
VTAPAPAAAALAQRLHAASDVLHHFGCYASSASLYSAARDVEREDAGQGCPGAAPALAALDALAARSTPELRHCTCPPDHFQGHLPGCPRIAPPAPSAPRESEQRREGGVGDIGSHLASVGHSEREALAYRLKVAAFNLRQMGGSLCRDEAADVESVAAALLRFPALPARETPSAETLEAWLTAWLDAPPTSPPFGEFTVARLAAAPTGSGT